jgi:hypothetical protein
MKKTLLTVALVAVTAATSFAQGKVTFGNDATRTFVLGEVAPGDTAGPVSGPVAGGRNLVAALYAGTSASSLTLQTSIALTGTDLPSPGRMANKAVILTVPGGVAQTFQIVLFDSGGTAPTSLNGLALAGSFGGTMYFGTSGLFTATPGTSIAYPFIYQTTAPVSSTWAAGSLTANVVPEPSSMVLAGLGAASLLLFRRRK